MVDNQIDGEVIGVAMDGLGFGTDGKMWGGEFFVADYADAERIAHLAYVPLAGGARAIREPWRLAATYLQRAFGNDFTRLDLPFVRNIDRREWTTLRSMIDAGINCPETSSVGRLFDAISGLLCLRSFVNYEGQAAIELEAIADPNVATHYEFLLNDSGNEINADGVVREVVGDLLAGISRGEISAKFHVGLAHLIVSIALRVREGRGLNRVALSGGVFQNMFLLSRVSRLLREHRFEVFTHSRVPTNDGGISLGQAAVANALIKSGRAC
jgi:hydrogenase maturation protein HypF